MRFLFIILLFENDDFILAFLQETARQIQRLLRADTPIPSQIDAVYEDDSFAPVFHVEESIARSSHFKGSAIQHGQSRIVTSGERVDIRYRHHWQLIHLPTTRDLVAVDSYRTCNTFVILGNSGTVERHVDLNTVPIDHPIEFAQLLPVDVNECIIGQSRYFHQSADGLVEVASIENVTLSLVQCLESKRRFVLNGFHLAEHLKYICRFVELNRLEFDNRNTRRNRRNFI